VRSKSPGEKLLRASVRVGEPSRGGRTKELLWDVASQSPGELVPQAC
jgi:hypothetical protein